MWILVLLLNLLGRKNFLRFLAGWMLIMAFFLYCFVHEAFDQPWPTQTRSRAAHRTSTRGARVGVRLRPLAPAVDCCQRLLDGSFYVVVLPPLVPLVRQIARADRGLNRLCTGAVRKSIDRRKQDRLAFHRRRSDHPPGTRQCSSGPATRIVSTLARCTPLGAPSVRRHFSRPPRSARHRDRLHRQPQSGARTDTVQCWRRGISTSGS